MEGIAEIRERHLRLRDSVAAWIRTHFDDASWYYQPTPVSNPAAWIVPHLLAFEQQFVFDKIPGRPVPPGVSAEVVERYKPGVAGFETGKGNLMSLEEALSALARMREISNHFLSQLILASPAQPAVDPQQVVELYQHNFTHDTEHFGQLKYLSGTWGRLSARP
jgi:hypothetical protein